MEVMSAVECKVPGFYKHIDDDPEDDGDWGVDTEEFKSSDECSYALGKQARRERQRGIYPSWRRRSGFDA